ncbi:hypothetical protein [Thermoflexibacter ruber]|uniref:Uncharacterized protein n=1 Tax=Thermoflexibacter ruber TaxID=1003 RepID=A0A1I2CL74_9BACT|nr:hypothetical protein [Thermoflexibacter ruber]SFE68912.1 hypothetical protein SAMN04488541_100556 [Thermoflexibacter ruber]
MLFDFLPCFYANFTYRQSDTKIKNIPLTHQYTKLVKEKVEENTEVCEKLE